MKKFVILVFALIAMFAMMSLTSCGQKQEAETLPESSEMSNELEVEISDSEVTHVQLPDFDKVAAAEGEIYLFKTATTVESIENDFWWTRVEVINIEDYKISGISSICLNPVNGTAHMAPHFCEEEGHLDCGVYVQDIDDGLIMIYFNSPAFNAYHAWYMLVPRDRVTYRVSY